MTGDNRRSAGKASGDNRRSIGKAYEDKAEEYVRGLGWQVLERNYRIKTGEIDIIARDGKCLVFIEVKYRKNDAFGTPLDAVDIRKQRKISRTAQYYYMANGYAEDHKGRFDVIGMYGDGSINHIKNAFELC